MVKTQINFRASDHTAKQIEELIAKTGMLQTELIAVAIDRMHREEFKGSKMNTNSETANKVLDINPDELTGLSLTDIEYLIRRTQDNVPYMHLTKEQITEAAQKIFNDANQ